MRNSHTTNNSLTTLLQLIRWNQTESDRGREALQFVDNMCLETTLGWKTATISKWKDNSFPKSIMYIHTISTILRDIGHFNTMLSMM